MDRRELPSHWQIARFREVVSYSLGRTPPRNQIEYWQSGRYPWVSIADMEQFGTITYTKEKVSTLAFEQIFNRRAVPAGTLLMSFKLTIGRVSILGQDALHNEAIISVKPGPLLDRDFLMFYLPTIDFADHQDRAVKGNTLNKSKIDELPVPLPPLPEQRAIARALRAVQEAREARQRELELERERKAALMEHLFTHGTRGEARKQTEIGEMPESWEVVRLAHIAQVRRSGVHPSERPDALYVGLEHIEPGASQVSAYGSSSDVISSKWQFFTGDVLYGKLRPYLDKAAITNFNGMCSTDIIVLVTQGGYTPEFLVYLLHTNSLLEYAKRNTTGVNHPRTSWAAIEKYNFPCPTTDEAQELGAILAACDAKLQALSYEIALLEEVFRAMLEELMSGRLSAVPLAVD